MDRKEAGNILIYKNEKGDTKIDVYFENNEIWLTQSALADLYQTSPQNITMHIKNIYADNELVPESTCKGFLQVQIEGGRSVERNKKHYNFQMILAIGYRVRSNVGVHFRNWVSKVITEYSQKGFAMNDERLKNPQAFGVDYFDELLARIKDIRSSEKRFYEKVKEIYATSIDYDPKTEQAKVFFATVQNKMHYSVHGRTAAELIVERANAKLPNMGLTSFKGAVVRKTDIDIAKNYLSQNEIEELNRVVSLYLDYAEDQARKQIPMHMADWEEKLNGFLKFTGREVLENSGKISAELAKKIADEQYEDFDRNRKRMVADTDALINEATEIKKLKK